MTHNKIKTCADFTSPRVALQNQLCPLQQKRGLRRVFLGSQLLQPSIEVLRNTKIHSHTVMVPNRYPPLTSGPDMDTPPRSGASVFRTSISVRASLSPRTQLRPRHNKTDNQEERTLGVWLHTQRIDARAGKLAAAKEKQLNKVTPGWRQGRVRRGANSSLH